MLIEAAVLTRIRNLLNEGNQIPFYYGSGSGSATAKSYGSGSSKLLS
jgi:hypothetical protein